MLYRQWQYEVSGPELAPVLPDGCRDLILVQRAGQIDAVVYTGWDAAPRSVALQPGTTLTGYRLSPGCWLTPELIAAATHEPLALAQMLEAEAAPDPELGAAIDALTRPAATVEAVARAQGVSARTFQRRFADLSLPSPDYWRQLGRARRAAQALPGPQPLIEIACDFGYSDQAHMTRDFLRWFGAPPARLRRKAPRLRLILEPGLGNWSEPA